MQAKKGNVRVLGSCNFCDRGRFAPSGMDLIYPYKEVYEIDGGGIRVRFCSDCIETIKDIDTLVDATNVMRELAKNV